MNAQWTLKLIRIIANVPFRPFTSTDFDAFADAAMDAQYGEPNTTELDRFMTEYHGSGVNVTDCVVVVSDGRFEVIGSVGEGDQVVLSFDVNPILI